MAEQTTPGCAAAGEQVSGSYVLTEDEAEDTRHVSRNGKRHALALRARLQLREEDS